MWYTGGNQPVTISYLCMILNRFNIYRTVVVKTTLLFMFDRQPVVKITYP
jgi:predicted YcjX-like family ATPase